MLQSHDGTETPPVSISDVPCRLSFLCFFPPRLVRVRFLFPSTPSRLAPPFPPSPTATGASLLLGMTASKALAQSPPLVVTDAIVRNTRLTVNTRQDGVSTCS